PASEPLFAVCPPLLRPPMPPLCPYTTLFRSLRPRRRRGHRRRVVRPGKVVGIARGRHGVLGERHGRRRDRRRSRDGRGDASEIQDRKSTRLNSSHQIISYAVFCLKKKRTTTQ